MKRVFRSLIKRPIKNYNVEERAHKLIDKREKALAAPTGKTSDGDPDHIDLSIVVAPKHESSQEHIDRVRKDHPEYLDEYKRKDEGLLERMAGMTANPEKFSEIASRPLPKSSGPVVYDTEFGYKEPSVIPEGKCSIRQAVHFITEYSKNPETYTAAHIARDYKLEEEKVRKVLKHFQTLKVKFKKDPTRYDQGESTTPQKLLNTVIKDSTEK